MLCFTLIAKVQNINDITLPLQAAAKNFWLVDHMGLLSTGRPELSAGQSVFAKQSPELEGMKLLEVVKTVKPDILLGLSGVGRLFTEDIIKEMYKHTKRPIIFPLSNPTDKAECTAQYAFQFSH